MFAPELALAAFGGDPDNFQFPRWDLDVALLRAYDRHGAPAHTPGFLHLDFKGPKAGEPVFVVGNPGSTYRDLTVAQLLEMRDVELPHAILRDSRTARPPDRVRARAARERRHRADGADCTGERAQGAAPRTRRAA